MAKPQGREARLQALRDRFLAVSLRSRTLRLTRTSKSGAFDLSRLPPASVAWLVKVLGGPTDPPVKPGPIAEVAADSPLSVDVSALAYAARTQRMETGSDDLAVGFPFLEGKTADGTWLRAPLFLYPVALGQTSTGKLRWTLAPTGPAYLNETLCETLRRLAGVRLTMDDFLARDEDGRFKIDDATWFALVDTLRAAGLELDAMPELPGEPAPLEPKTEDERAALPAGRFNLRFHLVLGRFPASASTLVNDYDQLLERLAEPGPHPLGVAGSVLAVDEDELTPQAELPEAAPAPTTQLGLRRWQVLPSDGSQDEVFRFVERLPGRAGPLGLVVQGPPGTGKSQLITNLLAAEIATGHRVLLVCQKRAALDVVAERLERMGLREPIAVVHDVQADRNPLCASIAQTLDGLLEADDGEGTTELDKALGRIDKAVARAETDLGRRLGESQAAFEALTTDGDRPALAALDEHALAHGLRPEDALPDLSAEVASLDVDDLPDGLRELETVAELAAPLAPPHPLAVRTDWASYDEAALNAVRHRLQAATSALAAWAPHAHAPGLPNDVLAAERPLLMDARPLVELASDTDRRLQHALFVAWHGMATAARVPQAEVGPDGPRSGSAGAARPHGDTSDTTLARLRVARDQLPKVPPELVTRPRAEVDTNLSKLEKLEDLAKRWWRIFLPAFWILRGLPNRIVRSLTSPVRLGARPTPDLIALHRGALAWQDLLAELPEHPVFHLQGVGDPAHLDRPIGALERGFAKLHLERRVRAALASQGAPFTDPGGPPSWQGETPSPFLSRLASEHARASSLDALERALAALEPDLERAFLERVRTESLLDPELARGLLAELIGAAPDMKRAAELDRALAPKPAWVRAFLRRYPQAGARHDVLTAARLAVHEGWRTLLLAGRAPAELEQALLDPKLAQGIGLALDEVRKLAADGALGHWRRRLQQARLDAGRLKGLQRLSAEVHKKRNRATLRQLYERHADELGLVRPIWFCSPEAVAALFPLTADLFDFVIFDEASQCPVEAAIPALVRAKTAMIAGDDQQMPPTHFFQAAIDEEVDFETGEDGGALLAAQSILTLARVALPTTTLSWHYRCRHEELIALSNAAFYGRKLATAPNAEQRARLACEGLHWEPVEGRWKDQTNEVEAERVVSLVQQILSESMPDGRPPTLGIVAMNRPQAELIERRIEARAASDEAFRATLQRDLERPVIDQLFVRNLENVQGDERDVMILSLAYGPSDKGGKVQARFGPLGLEGGEKRLNVAITRARLGLWVVASCSPEQLAVDQTTHPGPKLLKTFLAFVRASAPGPAQDLATAKTLLDQAASIAAGGERAAATPRRPLSGRLGRSIADLLAKALDERGLVVTRDLGLGRLSLDLAVRRPEDPVLRVGVDTSGFLSRRDAMTRDCYVPTFWQRVGWSLVRVTPGAWRRDPASVIRHIEAALDGAGPTPKRRPGR